MTSFTAITLTDITNFLITNNQSISTNFIYNYLNTFNLMKYVSTVPSSIADWFIAFDLINQPIPIYKTSTILFSSETQLTSLAQSLTLPSVDKERIIRILSYLHKLDPDMSIIDTLPNDILKQILIELDCESILLICKISNKMRSFCDNELKSILQENLTRTTKLILRDYDLEDLLRLCKNQTNKNNIAASHHTLLLTSNHQVYVFGANSTDGRLGLGDNARDENTPIFLDDLPNGIQVACGSAHSLILIANGQVYGFGANQNGNLGLGNNVTVVMPTAITNLRNIGQITCGYSHSLALTNTGKVYAFGSNFVGELGLGDNINKNTPTLIDNLDNIV